MMLTFRVEAESETGSKSEDLEEKFQCESRGGKMVLRFDSHRPTRRCRRSARWLCRRSARWCIVGGGGLGPHTDWAWLSPTRASVGSQRVGFELDRVIIRSLVERLWVEICIRTCG
jgi:hypothetical protein